MLGGEGRLAARRRWLTFVAGLAAAAAIVASASASFVPASGSPVAVGDAPDFIASADFDSDGNLDIASANTGSSDVTILLGAGDGTFTEEPTESPITVGTSPLGIV